MIKTLVKCVRDAKIPTILTPIFMLAEAFCEVSIPTIMANMIDDGISVGNMDNVIKYGVFLLVFTLASMFFGITRSTVSKVLKLLEKKGMIERKAVSHDGRMKKIVLTDKSREIGRKMHEQGEKAETQLTNGFTPDELKTLCGFLDRIQANLETSDSNA